MPPPDFGRSFFLKKCKRHEISDNAGVGRHLKLLEMLLRRESDGERNQMGCRNALFQCLTFCPLKLLHFERRFEVGKGENG